MANTIKVKRSSVPGKVPGTGDLELGEIAVNTYDGKMYIEKNNGTASVVQIGDVVGAASSTDNALVRFDGTTGKLVQNGTITQDDSGNLAGILSEQFSDGTAVTVAAGKQWYNGTTGSWNLGMGGGNITQQVGEELFVYGKASSAISDTNLQLVYQTGTVGASGVVTFAPTISGITDANLIIGCATESISTNGFGRITAWGIVHGINTTGSAYSETWADGDIIWYNPTTGGLTKTKPSAPNIKVQIGTVINAGAGSGSFSVEINHGSTLGGTDSNVQITSPASGNLLVYDASAGYWKNANITAGTGISVTNGAGSVTIANTGVTSITGTASQITASASTGGVTLSLPSTINVNTSGTAAGLSGTPNITVGTINATSGTFTGVLTPTGGIVNGAVFNKTGAGAEGGELQLEKGATSTLSGNAVIDLYGQSVRFFDAGGTNKGATLDISAQSAGVASVILTSSTSAASFPTLNQNTTGNAASATNLAGGAANKVPYQTGSGATAFIDAPTTANQVLSYNGSALVWAVGAGSGTVTSVAMTVPTGLSISGSPITTSGTLALTFTAGYSIPTTASQTNWDTAYSDRLKWDGGSTGLVAATGRTSLGATTLGSNLFTITNPSAVTFPRFNADNTVSALDAATFRSAIGAGTGSGTVTSVGITAGTGISVSGSPVTSSGNITVSLASIAGSYYYDTFTATAGQTSFSTSQTYTSGKISVYKNGTKMRNGTDVTVTSGNAVVFAVACTVGDIVDVDYPATAIAGTNIFDVFTATASQTTFTTSATYTANKISVYKNGAKMRNGSDVTVTSGTSVVFATACTAGDLIDVNYPI